MDVKPPPRKNIPSKIAPDIVRRAPKPVPQPRSQTILEEQKIKLPKVRVRGWKNFGAWFLAAALFCALYLPLLGSWPPTRDIEQPVALGFNGLNAITQNILFAPQKLIDFAILKLDFTGTMGYRAVSAAIIFISIVCFFLLIKRWVSFRIAVLSTILFASSSWMLFQARSAELNASYILVIPLIFLLGTLIAEKVTPVRLSMLVALAAICLYVPGTIWLFLLGFILYFSVLKSSWSSNRLIVQLAWMCLFVLPLLPLFYYLARDTELLKAWAGLPDVIYLGEIKDNLLSLPKQLFISGTDDPTTWLPGTPIIDSATAVLTLGGLVYLFRERTHPMRRRIIVAYLALSTVLLAFLGSVMIALFLPLFYILAAIGLTFLLDQWFHIFPKNPFARSMGFTLVLILAILISAFHITRYYVAWPRAEATKQVFQLK